MCLEKKDDIAIAVKGELNDAMKNYGFDIIKTLVTDIDPDAQVKESMNRINASEREKVAAQFEGDENSYCGKSKSRSRKRKDFKGRCATEERLLRGLRKVL